MLLIVDWSAAPVKKLPSAVTGAGAGVGAGVVTGGEEITGAGNVVAGAAGTAVSCWGVDVDAVAGEG